MLQVKLKVSVCQSAVGEHHGVYCMQRTKFSQLMVTAIDSPAIQSFVLIISIYAGMMYNAHVNVTA